MRRTLLAGGFVIGSAAFPKEPPLAFSKERMAAECAPLGDAGGGFSRAC